MKMYYVFWESKKGSKHRTHVVARTLESAKNRVKQQYGSKISILDHRIGEETGLKAGIKHTE